MKPSLVRYCVLPVIVVILNAFALDASAQDKKAPDPKLTPASGDLFAEKDKPYKVKVKTSGSAASRVLTVKLSRLEFDGTAITIGAAITKAEIEYEDTTTTNGHSASFDITPKIPGPMNILVQVYDPQQISTGIYAVGYTVVALPGTTKPGVNSPIGVGRN